MTVLIYTIFVVLITNKVYADYLQCYVCEDCEENEGYLAYCPPLEDIDLITVQETTQSLEVDATTDDDMDILAQEYIVPSNTTTVIYPGDVSTTTPNPTQTTADIATVKPTTIPITQTTASEINNLTMTEIIQPPVYTTAVDVPVEMNELSTNAQGDAKPILSAAETVSMAGIENVTSFGFPLVTFPNTTLFAGNSTTPNLEEDTNLTAYNQSIGQMYETLTDSEEIDFNDLNSTFTDGLESVISNRPNEIPSGTFDTELEKETTMGGELVVKNSTNPDVLDINSTLPLALPEASAGNVTAFGRPNSTTEAGIPSNIFGNVTTVVENVNEINGDMTNQLELTGPVVDILNQTASEIASEVFANSTTLAELGEPQLSLGTLSGNRPISNINLTNFESGAVLGNIPTTEGFNDTDINYESVTGTLSSLIPLQPKNITSSLDIPTNIVDLLGLMKTRMGLLENQVLPEPTKANEISGGKFRRSTSTQSFLVNERTSKQDLVRPKGYKPVPSLVNKYQTGRAAAQVQSGNVTYKCYTVRVKGQNKIQINKGCVAVPADRAALGVLVNRYGLDALEDCQVCSEDKCNRSCSGVLRFTVKTLVVIILAGWMLS